MKEKIEIRLSLVPFLLILTLFTSFGQIGTRFPSEKKIVTDPITGTMLTFLTSKPVGDSKIYQTHSQWTSDGNWIIFRSDRVKGEAFAVNEKSGNIVQVTEGSCMGMLNIARKSMKLYFMRNHAEEAGTSNTKSNRVDVLVVDLAKLFSDSESKKLKPASEYQTVCGTTPSEMGAGGDLALDADEEFVYFRVGKEDAARHLPQGTKLEGNFGPRNMGAGPTGIGKMNLKTGESSMVVAVPFQVGHIQANPWVTGEIVFCWETGGKAPQRTWTVLADGSGLRPLYPEAVYEWVTHESLFSKDEVAFAIMGHRKVEDMVKSVPNASVAKTADPINPGHETEWGPCGSREKATGLGIVNLRTREMTIAGQIPYGSGVWHVNGSSDGRWATGDDFLREIYLFDRHSCERLLLSAGHKETASDHPHPTFSPDGTRIVIQSAMLSEDNKSMNICVIPLPEAWLKRKY